MVKALKMFHLHKRQRKKDVSEWHSNRFFLFGWSKIPEIHPKNGSKLNLRLENRLITEIQPFNSPSLMDHQKYLKP